MMKRSSKAALTATIAMLGMAVPAGAQDRTGLTARTVEVQFDDLDVSREADADMLRDRIETAISRLCPRRIEGPVKKYLEPRECRRLAWQSVESQMARLEDRRAIRIALAPPLTKRR